MVVKCSASWTPTRQKIEDLSPGRDGQFVYTNSDGNIKFRAVGILETEDNINFAAVTFQNPAVQTLFGTASSDFDSIPTSAQRSLYDSLAFGDETKLYRLSCGVDTYQGTKKLRVWALSIFEDSSAKSGLSEDETDEEAA